MGKWPVGWWVSMNLCMYTYNLQLFDLIWSMSHGGLCITASLMCSINVVNAGGLWQWWTSSSLGCTLMRQVQDWLLTLYLTNTSRYRQVTQVHKIENGDGDVAIRLGQVASCDSYPMYMESEIAHCKWFLADASSGQLNSESTWGCYLLRL